MVPVVFGGVVSTVPFLGVLGKLCCRGWLVRVAHCWVLRQQGRFAAMRDRGWLFLVFPVRAGRAPLWPFLWGWVCGVCGVGLLFENYIVDASILYSNFKYV